jgi:membrane protein YdbS with pleckstrin-like domain
MPSLRLLANEKVIYHAHPHFLFLLGPLLLLFFVWLAISIWICPVWEAVDLAILCPFNLTMVMLFVSSVVILDWLTNRLYLTNFRVIKERGIIGKKYTSIWLGKIQDVSSQVSFLGEIFGFGDLLIESAGELGQERFRGLPKPIKIREMIEAEINKIPSSLI